MRFHCFQKICRTGRLESATGTGPANQGEDRRERALINTNENPEQAEHQGARIEARFARRNHSSSNAR
jgi:hypothetical protein